MSRPDKARLLARLQERIAAELQTLRESQRAAQDGATHEETRQEDPKDTRWHPAEPSPIIALMQKRRG